MFIHAITVFTILLSWVEKNKGHKHLAKYSTCEMLSFPSHFVKLYGQTPIWHEKETIFIPDPEIIETNYFIIIQRKNKLYH